MSITPTRWTNASVRRIAGGRHPVTELTERARRLVRDAMDAGWGGPPFDPIALAEILGIPVIPRDDIRDARLVPTGRDRVRIEFNPNRPPMRVRYSVAHEIAHTLFPDYAELVRNRVSYHELTNDQWQLEALCNVGAAELLMPAGSMPPLAVEELTAEQILALRQRFQVSTEALLIRIAKMSDLPCAAFCASREERGSSLGPYRVDYLVGSPAWEGDIGHGAPLPAQSAVSECVAIGFTASRRERWSHGPPLRVECVAIPPYPGRLTPRVAGLAVVSGHTRAESLLVELRGDAMEPRGRGTRVIAHIVNDATPNWGGGGFAAALARRHPAIQQEFRAWARTSREALSLGHTHTSQLDQQRTVFHMVAQRGYGQSVRPRIRYAALQACLKSLGEFAAQHDASVHMPRIGTGQAGGAWDIIRDIIRETVCAQGIRVTVYDPPNRETRTRGQSSLPLGTT